MSHRKLLNLSEQKVYELLVGVVPAHDAHVFPKVRIADVIEINNSGITDELYRFALQAHFDFVVADSKYDSQFVVEFDGPYHNTKDQCSRDLKKNKLCEYFEIPLLRLNDDFLNTTFAQTDILSWLSNAWFCWQSFIEQQSLGKIDFYESFDPTFVRLFPGCQDEFPLWLSRRNQSWLRKQFFEGIIPDFSPSHIVVKVPDGSFQAFAWILTSATGGAVSRSSIQGQKFPVGLCEIVRELALFGLKANVMSILNSSEIEVAIDSIFHEARQLRQNNEVRHAYIGGKLNPLYKHGDN